MLIWQQSYHNNLNLVKTRLSPFLLYILPLSCCNIFRSIHNFSIPFTLRMELFFFISPTGLSFYNEKSFAFKLANKISTSSLKLWYECWQCIDFNYAANMLYIYSEFTVRGMGCNDNGIIFWCLPTFKSLYCNLYSFFGELSFETRPTNLVESVAVGLLTALLVLMP